MIYLLYPRMFLSSGDPVKAAVTAGMICIYGKSAFSLRDGTGSQMVQGMVVIQACDGAKKDRTLMWSSANTCCRR